MDDKTEILNRINFLEEYQKIGIRFDGTEPNSAGWVPCHAIDRDDQNASAAINLQNGFYTDLGNGGRKLDFFALMQIQGGFRSFLDVLNHYRKQFGMEEYHERKNAKTKTPETEVDILPWNANGDRWCGLKSTNREAVERAGGFLCRYQKNRICVGFQVFAEPTPDKSATGYVVAQTDGSPLPKFDRSGNQIGEAKYKIVAGTQTGMIGTEAMLSIYKAREAGTLDDLTVIKVEGVSDLTALLARVPVEKREQIVVLTNACGAGEKPKDAWRALFEGVNVVVVHDADSPGQTGAAVWCRWLDGTAQSIRNVVLPYEVSENHGRDLKDFLCENSFNDFLQLVQDAELYQSDGASVSAEFAADSPVRLATEYLNRLCKVEAVCTLVYQQGMWYHWHDGCYEYMPTEFLQAKLTQFCHTIFLEDYQTALSAWQASRSKEKPPLVRKVTARLVSDVLNFLRSLTITDHTEDMYWRDDTIPEEYRNMQDLIPVKNGVLSIKRMLERRSDYLLPTTPLLFIRNVLAVEFNPDAVSMPWCNMVEQNLQDVDGGWTKLNLLQEFFGYCLVPDTSLQKFLLCIGEGSNGKSAVMTGFAAMLGEKNLANLSLEMFSDRFALAQLRGKLVNLVDDMSETDKVCEGKLKSVVSGMNINSDRKNKDGINFKPLSRLIFCCNTPPKFQDKSNGIWRRLIMIPFCATVPENQRDVKYCDSAFWEQESAGIFNWCLAGLLRLRKNNNKFMQCPENEAEKRAYIYDSNPVLLFFEETLQVSDDGSISCATLYKTYEEWCISNGYRPLNASNFGREVIRKFQVSKVRRWVNSAERVSEYCGIQVQPGRSLVPDSNF